MAQSCEQGPGGAARVVPPPALPGPSRDPHGMPIPLHDTMCLMLITAHQSCPGTHRVSLSLAELSAGIQGTAVEVLSECGREGPGGGV